MSRDPFSAITLAGSTLAGARIRRSRNEWIPSDPEKLDLPPPDPSTSQGDAIQTGASLEVRRFSASFSDPLSFCIESRLAQFQFLSLPPADDSEIPGMVELELEKRKLLPLQLDQMTVSTELLSHSDEAIQLLVAAVRNDAIDALPPLTGLSPARIQRIDIAALAALRALRAQDPSAPYFTPGRHLLLLDEASHWTLLVLHNASPILIRSLGPTSSSPASLLRAIRLSLLQADSDLASPSPIASTTLLSHEAHPALLEALHTSSLGPTLLEPTPTPSDSSGLVASGTVLRSAENAPFNLVPLAWRQDLANRRHRRTLLQILIGGILLWALFAAALFLGPSLLDKAIASEKAALDNLAPAVTSVNDVRHRVRLISSYEDRTISPLEVLREICLLLPDGITFSSIRYNRKDTRLVISASATSTALVYEFKQNVDKHALFPRSQLTSGPTTNTRTGSADFELTILLLSNDEDDAQQGDASL